MTLRDTHVNMGHGGGGQAMHALIAEVFATPFDNPPTRKVRFGASSASSGVSSWASAP